MFIFTSVSNPYPESDTDPELDPEYQPSSMCLLLTVPQIQHCQLLGQTVRKGQEWFWFKVNIHGLFRVYSLKPGCKWIYTEKSVHIYFESESQRYIYGISLSLSNSACALLKNTYSRIVWVGLSLKAFLIGTVTKWKWEANKYFVPRRNLCLKITSIFTVYSTVSFSARRSASEVSLSGPQ
jgi:hypothetical protein